MARTSSAVGASLQFPERSLKVSAETALLTIEETTGRTFANDAR